MDDLENDVFKRYEIYTHFSIDEICYYCSEAELKYKCESCPLQDYMNLIERKKNEKNR